MRFTPFNNRDFLFLSAKKATKLVGALNAVLQYVGLSSQAVAYLSQATWYVDPSNTSAKAADTNDGKTATTPLRTKAELMRRIGARNGPIAVNMTVTFLSDEPDQSDTTPFDIDCSVNDLLVNGTMKVMDQGTLTAATGITRGSSESGLGTMTAGSASASNYWTQWVGYIVEDTTVSTAGARAWVYKDQGSKKASISTLRDNKALGFTFSNFYGSSFSTTRTPGNTDNYVVKRPCKITTTTVNSYGGRINFSGFWFQSFQGSNVATTPTFAPKGSSVGFQDCRFDLYLDLKNVDGAGGWMSNCYVNAFSYCGSNNPFFILGGYTYSPTGNFILDSDVICRFIYPGPNMLVGTAYVYGSNRLNDTYGPFSPVLTVGPFVSIGCLWGPGSFDVRYGGRLNWDSSQTAAQTFLLATLTLDGASTAISFDGTTWRSGIALSNANLDAAAGAAGFGGWARGGKGSVIAKGT